MTGTRAARARCRTSDEKSSADCVGATRQYCGATGSIALCQVAARDCGISAPFVADEEVYGGLDLRQSIRELVSG